MTFEEFQATGQPCENIERAIDSAQWNDVPARGRLYASCLYIEEMPVAGWPNDRTERWHLTLERDGWISDDLAELERKLYDFAVDCGYLD